MVFEPENCRLTASERCEILAAIRAAAAGKLASAPCPMTEDELASWKQNRPEHRLRVGLAAVWDGVEAPDDAPVAIRKKGGRDTAHPYLVFETNSQLSRYRAACHSLGMSAYYLAQAWLTPRLIQFAKQNGLPETAYEQVQSAVERAVGLHFRMEDTTLSDEHLAATVTVYLKKIAVQQASAIFGRLSGMFVYIDAYEFDFADAGAENPCAVLTVEAPPPETVDYRAFSVDVQRMLASLLGGGEPGKRFDLKDRLLPLVIGSARSVIVFLREFYVEIRSRLSVWRPVSLAYQVSYAFRNGEIYLKNPRYLAACGDTTLGGMVSAQAALPGKDASLAARLGDAHDALERDGLLAARLIECAESVEQIGKALSKELRTPGAITALARALPYAAAERNPEIGIRFS